MLLCQLCGGEIVGGTRVVAGGGCSRYEQKRRAAGWAPCQSNIQATLGLLIHAQSRTGVLQYDLLRFYLPHASAPLDAQVFFVSHCLCTCVTLQISVRACPSGSSEPRNSTTIVRCIGSKKAASQRSRTSQEDNVVKPKSLALGIAAIRKVTIFPVLWISNCTWQRDSGLSNVAFGNTAVCITRCIGTVQSFRIYREPVVSHCPLLLVQ